MKAETDMATFAENPPTGGFGLTQEVSRRLIAYGKPALMKLGSLTIRANRLPSTPTYLREMHGVNQRRGKIIPSNIGNTVMAVAGLENNEGFIRHHAG